MPRPKQKRECFHDRPYYAQGLCRACYHRYCYARRRELITERARQRYQDDPAWREKKKRSNRHKRRRYISMIKTAFGMPEQALVAMETAQQNCCAICGTPPQQKPLHLDHDHTTNRVRGLLCTKCNTGLGWVEQTTWLEAALQYLAICRRHLDGYLLWEKPLMGEFHPERNPEGMKTVKVVRV